MEASKCIKQLLKDIKEEIGSNTVIVKNINTPLTSVNRSTNQKVKKEIVAFNDQIDLTVVYRRI